MPEAGQVVEVWLGAFGPPKPYGAQPGDTWSRALVIACRGDGSVFARRLEFAPHKAWVLAKHWRACV